MSINFLYPLAWLGGLAIAVPIWLHLRQRDDPDLVRFSALQFLEDQPVARQRSRRWPQNWPLLLLRILALLLLVAAFAWPYLVSRQEIVVEESRVYILDNTLSHQAHRGFEQGRDEIIGQLRSAGLETQIAVVELAHQPRVVVNFGDGRDGAIDRLQSLQPSHQRGSYLGAFRQADRLLQQSLGARRRVVLLGDSQQNQWTEGQGIPPFMEGIDVTLPEVTESESANVALMEPIASWDFGGQRPLVRCAVTLYHQSEVETAQITFLANGERLQRRDVPLSDQPESLTLMTEWEADPNDWVQGQIQVEGATDILPNDNQVFFSLPPVRAGRLAILADSPFLKAAVSPDVMRGRWTTRVLTSADFPLPQQELSDQDVLCLTAKHLESSDVRDMVLDFLNSGRGVFLVIDRVNPVISGFMRRLDLECLPDSPQSSASRGLRYIFLEHPIFRPFRSADFGNLTEISVVRYRRLSMPHATPLVFSDAGDPLLLASQKTKGRLLVLAFSLDRQETDWPLHATFIPFLDRCLRHLRSEITMPVEYRPGESCIWRIPAGREVDEIVLSAADRRQADMNCRAPVDEGQARFEIPANPGLYVLRHDDREAVEGVFAVNPSPLESRLRYSDSSDVVAQWSRRGAESDQRTDLTEFTPELSQASILRQRFWWWLALGGLVALVVETMWLAMRKERT